VLASLRLRSSGSTGPGVGDGFRRFGKRFGMRPAGVGWAGCQLGENRKPWAVKGASTSCAKMLNLLETMLGWMKQNVKEGRFGRTAAPS
jgi:hypothetical protein